MTTSWPSFGSDLIVERLIDSGITRFAFNPGATFRGIHDSLVQGPHEPSIVLCTHEAVAVAVAHGYAKAAGRPMAVLLHDVVGLQLGAMAVFNAWCDRVPMLLVGGTGPLSVGERRPWIDWIHTANVQGQVVRDFTKWDDQPADLDSVPESLGRALATANSEPAGPVYVCFDTTLQEQAIEGTAWGQAPSAGGASTTPTDPAPDPAAIAVIAQQLRNAQAPVLLTDYAGATSNGFRLLAELAEQTQAWVVDLGARFNLDTGHPLNASGFEDEVLAAADVVVAIDVEDLYGALLGTVAEGTPTGVRIRSDVRVSHLTPQHLKLRAWAQDAQRLVPLDHHVTASAPRALEALLEALEREPVPAEVRQRRAETSRGRRAAALNAWRHEAERATSDDGLHPAAVALALEAVLHEEPWTLVNGSLEGWERRLWRFERFGQHLGWHGGGGLGYGLGASIGAAMHLAPDRICVDLQPDGDLLYTPSALWTLANQRLPLLVVVLDNGQYGNTVGHAQRLAAERGRDPGLRYVGAALTDPRTDFTQLARSFGVTAFGPAETAVELRQATAKALGIVRGGDPAIVHVRTRGL